MPVIGERKSRSIGKGYQYDPMYNLAESYLGLCNIHHENNEMDR